MTKGPRGLAHQRVHTGPNLISPQTLKACLHSRLILPFSHHAQLHTYNQRKRPQEAQQSINMGVACSGV